MTTFAGSVDKGWKQLKRSFQAQRKNRFVTSVFYAVGEDYCVVGYTMQDGHSPIAYVERWNSETLLKARLERMRKRYGWAVREFPLMLTVYENALSSNANVK